MGPAGSGQSCKLANQVMMLIPFILEEIESFVRKILLFVMAKKQGLRLVYHYV